MVAMSTPTLSQSVLMDAGDVADRLGMGRRTVLYFARVGVLPAVRIGRHVRFDRQQLEDWIREGGKALPAGWRLEAEREC